MITADEILEEVSNVFDCPVSLILSKNRSNREVEARHAAVFLIKTQTEQSNASIAKLFGYKHSQTVCSAKVEAENKIYSDMIYKSKITEITNSLVKMKLKLRQQGF